MNSKRERLVFDRYFKDRPYEIIYVGSDKGIAHFAHMLGSAELIECDAPDMVLVKDNEAIIMEHFQFDSFPLCGKKGSAQAREEARIDRVYEQTPATDEGVYFVDEMQISNSYEDYVKNVCENFNHHYKKIPLYKENLINNGIISERTVTKMMFIIEDTSKLGTLVLNSNKELVPVLLYACREFLNLLQESPDADYILSFTSADGKDFACFIDCDQLPAYIDDSCDYSSMRFMNFPPQVIMFKKYL